MTAEQKTIVEATSKAVSSLIGTLLSRARGAVCDNPHDGGRTWAFSDTAVSFQTLNGQGHSRTVYTDCCGECGT